jgi:hypothetical protein
MTTPTLSATYTEAQLEAALEVMNNVTPTNADVLAALLTNNGAHSVTADFLSYDATQATLLSNITTFGSPPTGNPTLLLDEGNGLSAYQNSHTCRY